MGNCIVKVDAECPLPNGEKMIRGTFKMASSYAIGGDALNLSNYLKTGGYPTVLVDSANGFTLRHNSGTAAAGVIKAQASGVNVGNVTSMVEPLATTDLSSINTSFIAIGPAY